MKLILKFTGMLFIEAVLFAFILRYTVVFDNPLILLFPGVFALIGGTTVVSVLFVVVFTAVTYLIAGSALALVYVILQKIIPQKFALTITLLVPLFILGAIAYSQFKQHNAYFHVGETPADCARLDASQSSWCYRNIYREYPIAEVCSKLDYGEAAQCWQFCKAAHNENCQDAIPSSQKNVETTIHE